MLFFYRKKSRLRRQNCRVSDPKKLLKFLLLSLPEPEVSIHTYLTEEKEKLTLVVWKKKHMKATELNTQDTRTSRTEKLDNFFANVLA